MQRPHLNSLRSLALALGWLVAGPLLAQLSDAFAPPANDNFAAAAEVAGSELSLEADLSFATTEPFEAHDFGHTAWWKWTAPTNGIYKWDTADSAGPVAVTIWGRDGLGQLELRASSPDLLTLSNTVVALRNGVFTARAEETLWLQASARLERSLGGLSMPDVIYLSDGTVIFWPAWQRLGTNYLARITLQRSLTPAPANDHFAARIPLVGTNAIFSFRLDSASSEEGEPRLPGDSLQRTAWWTWQAPGNGTARLRSTGTNGAPVLGVYQVGTFFALQRVATSATEFGNECHREWRGRDVLEWDVAADGRYEIQADRYPWNPLGTEFQLELTFTPAPANDDLPNAQLLEGNDLRLTVNNFGATRNADDPVLPGRTGNGSVWFRWTAPTRGILQVVTNEPIRFAEPSFEILPPGGGWFGSVFIRNDFIPCGGLPADLKPLPPFVPAFGIHQVYGTNNGKLLSGLKSHGTNSAVAQVEGEISLQLDGLFDTSGETVMNLLFTPPPANDSFANRIVLPAAAVKVGGRTFAAGTIYANPMSGRVVWWQWAAPESGTWVLRPKSAAAHHRFWLLDGGWPNPGRPARSTDWTPLLFNVSAGEVVHIAVGATEGFGDNVGFELVPAVIPSITLERRREVRNEAWTTLDTLNWPNGYDLPRVFESSPDLEHWTPVPSLDDWRFSTEVNEGEPQRFYRMRLLTD